MLTDLLRRCFLLQDLDDEHLQRLIAACTLLHLPRGETLMRQGDVGDSLYIVAAGRLRFYIEGESDLDTLVGEVSAGETVGEMALLTDEPRTATVRTIRDSLLLQLERAAFDQLVASSSLLMQRLAKMIVLRQTRIRSAAIRRAPAVITLVPLHKSLPVSWMREELVDHFARLGTVKSFDYADSLQDIQQHRNRPAGNREPLVNKDQNELKQWFTHHETTQQRLLLIGDSQATPWNESCIGAADLILLVGVAGGDATPGDVDRQVQAHQDGPECAAVDLVLLHENGSDRPGGTEPWLRQRRVRRHFHVRRTPDGMNRLGRILTDRAVGVVLSGGGARGFAHIGALKALSESSLPIDLIGGCSMGSLIAAQHALGWNWQEVLERNDGFWTRRKLWDYTVPFISLVAGRTGSSRLAKMFGDLRIEDLETKYYCVTSDLTHAALHVHDRGLLWKAVSASASIPGVLPPRIFDGSLHVDGGLLDNLPVGTMRELTRGPILALDVASKIDLSVDPLLSQLPTGGALLRRRLNPFGAKIETPNIIGILWRSAVLASIQRTSKVRSLADLYVRPDISRFGIFDFRQIQALVDCGYDAMQSQLSHWETLVAES